MPQCHSKQRGKSATSLPDVSNYAYANLPSSPTLCTTSLGFGLELSVSSRSSSVTKLARHSLVSNLVGSQGPDKRPLSCPHGRPPSGSKCRPLSQPWLYEEHRDVAETRNVHESVHNRMQRLRPGLRPNSAAISIETTSSLDSMAVSKDTVTRPNTAAASTEVASREAAARPVSASQPLLLSPLSLISFGNLGHRAQKGWLRIAILDGCDYPLVHPGARTCYVALARTSWFHCKSLAQLPARSGTKPAASPWSDRLVSEPPIHVSCLKAEQVQAGCLESTGYDGRSRLEYDVLVVPGGSSSDYAQRLGESGREAVRNFVTNGGGYCGVCAGACLALTGWHGDSLGLVNAGMKYPEEADASAALPEGSTGTESQQEQVKECAHDSPVTPEGSATKQRKDGEVYSTTDSKWKSRDSGICISTTQLTSKPLVNDESTTVPVAVEVAEIEGLAACDAVRVPSPVAELRDSSTKPEQKIVVAEDSGTKPQQKVVLGHEPFNIEMRFSKLGRRLLWDESRGPRFEPEEFGNGGVTMRYHNGPMMVIEDSPPEIILPNRDTGMCRAPAPESTLCVLGRMWTLPVSADEQAPQLASELQDSIGILKEDFGEGRAVLLAPHCESTHRDHLGPVPGKPRLRRVLQRAVLLAAAGPKAQRENRWLEESCHLAA